MESSERLARRTTQQRINSSNKEDNLIITVNKSSFGMQSHGDSEYKESSPIKPKLEIRKQSAHSSFKPAVFDKLNSS